VAEPIAGLPRPVAFSFADALAANLGIDQPPTPAPFALTYRVGEPVPEGTILAVWGRPMTIAHRLPEIPLALNLEEAVVIDLDYTYAESARRVYLS
jgi:hypothetical protein